MRKKGPTPRQLTTFAFILTTFFLIVGIYPLLRHGQPRAWSVGFAAILAFLGIVWPDVLRRPYAAWMSFGTMLGWINSRVFLTVAYYLLFSPAGFVMRLMGKDPLKRRFEPALSSYRVPRTARPASHMEHQF